MSPQLRSILINLGALGLIAIAFFAIANYGSPYSRPTSGETYATNPIRPAQESAEAQGASAAIAQTKTPGAGSAASSTPAGKSAVVTPKPARSKSKETPTLSPETTPAANENEVSRIKDPYPFPPESPSQINAEARAALVNILCTTRSASFRPVSASGVIIDPRGVILTNAHVAQYILLAQSGEVDLSCVIRTGSPASARWRAEVLYIPPPWVEEHAADINAPRPTGTGEHDYALLHILATADLPTGQAGGSSMPGSFPFLPVDTREAIGFIDDPVLAASYPAEFLGGMMAQFDLYPASSVTTIKDLLTFNAKTVDLISLGGVIEAQSGSSGGAVVNIWGHLIGIITTTSEGATTAERDLRAITLSYISRDLAAQTQFDLPTILGGDVALEAADFNAHAAPRLIQLFIDQLSKQQY